MNILGIHTTYSNSKEAIRIYQTLIKKQPNDPYLWIFLGFAYLAKGDYKRAYRCHQRAINLRPDDLDLKKYILFNRDSITEK